MLTFRGAWMIHRGLALAICACLGAAEVARAADPPSDGSVPPAGGVQPSAWIVELGGYGVFEPTFLGSKRYNLTFKPQIDFQDVADRHWLSFPNDAFDYSLVETSNFRAGPAASITLQSRIHGQDIDLRLGKADVNLLAGGFAEYYPLEYIRTRVELLQGVSGNNGFAANLSADYIWRPAADWTLTAGPRAQLVDDNYASSYFSTQLGLKNHNFVPFRAEGGLLSSGAEITGKYDWTKNVSAKFFIDYNQLMGDAADSPRVNSKGTTEQVIVGVGATYKFTIER
jgi:MipA family protein